MRFTSMLALVAAGSVVAFASTAGAAAAPRTVAIEDLTLVEEGSGSLSDASPEQYRGGGHGGYDRGGHHGGYDRGGRHGGGYNHGGYNHGGYNHGGYNHGGYNHGFQHGGGYHHGGYRRIYNNANPGAEPASLPAPKLENDL